MNQKFFNKTGCRCILKLQAKEDLQNPRCLRCLAVTQEKLEYDAANRENRRHAKA